MNPLAVKILILALVMNTAAFVTTEYEAIGSLLNTVVDFSVTIRPAPKTVSKPKTPVKKTKPKIQLKSTKVKVGQPLKIKIEKSVEEAASSSAAKKKKTADIKIEILNKKTGASVTTIEAKVSDEEYKNFPVVEKSIEKTQLLSPGNYVAVLSFNDEEGTEISQQDFKIQSQQQQALNAAVFWNEVGILVLLGGTLLFRRIKLRHA